MGRGTEPDDEVSAHKPRGRRREPAFLWPLHFILCPVHTHIHHTYAHVHTHTHNIHIHVHTHIHHIHICSQHTPYIFMCTNKHTINTHMYTYHTYASVHTHVHHTYVRANIRTPHSPLSNKCKTNKQKLEDSV